MTVTINVATTAPINAVAVPIETHQQQHQYERSNGTNRNTPTMAPIQTNVETTAPAATMGNVVTTADVATTENVAMMGNAATMVVPTNNEKEKS